MTAEPESFSLPIRCPDCGGTLTAEVGPVTAPSTPVLWTCPYCQSQLEADFGGPLRWIVKRHGDSTATH